MDRQLEDMVVVVTGGSRGIGAAIAQAAAAEGARVHLCSRNNDEGEAVARSIRDAGGWAHFSALNVTDAEDVRHVFGDILSREEQIDVLINNAGVHEGAPFQDETVESWQRMYSVNVMGTVLPSQVVVPHMIERKTGSIVNISSKAGVVGEPGHAAYSASKGAIIALTRAMAVELSPLGIRVNSVAPGPVNTGMFHSVMPSQDDRDALARQTPVGRIGEPDDVAHLALYFASPRSKWCTGQNFSLDGGLSILK